MLRVAMLSKWHVHAGGYAQRVQNSPDAEIVAVWDEDKKRGTAWAAELGVEFIPCLDQLLARKDIDAVICDAPTNMHTDIMIRAANAGKHIFTEKVATLTAPDCAALKKAVEANSIIFTISMPARTEAIYLYAKQLVDEGTLGDITMFRVRNGHDGATANWLPNYWFDPATTGGGAMMDLGCHPMYLARWLFGEAETVSSTFSNYTYHQIEDNAVCTVKFKNQTIGIVESSLAAFCAPYILEMYGTKGSYYVGFNGAFLATSKDGFQPIEIPVQPLPHPLDQFIDSCVHGAPVRYGIDEALGLTEMMDAAYRSAEKNRAVRIEEVYNDELSF